MSRPFTYTIICNDPFTVVYKDSSLGRTKEVKYEVPLTDSEIRENGNYITFDEPNGPHDPVPSTGFYTGKKPVVKNNIRIFNHGEGIIGLTLNLSLAHCQSLTILKERIEACQLSKEAYKAREVLPDMLKVLDFIVGNDFPSPLSSTLWEKEA